MKKEIIELTKFEIAPILDEWYLENNEEYYTEDGLDFIKGIWDDFEIIDTDTEYYSLEDEYAEIRVIVKRKSDDKYFEGFYTYFQWNQNEYNLKLTEVLPKEKTIIVYE